MTTLEDLLGIDPESPEVLRAEVLADNDRALLRSLIEIRKERGLTQKDVGKLLGISQPSVAEFEAHDSNPTLAKIRRYAHAVRALIRHEVGKDEGQLQDDSQRARWMTTSINRCPIEAVAQVTPPPAVVIRINPGTAPFQIVMDESSADSTRTDFALAA